MTTKLLITNLPLEISASALEDMFTMVGDVVSATVSADGRGVGQVEMASETGALDGIARFHGQVKSGSRLVVREDVPHLAVKTAGSNRRSLFQNGKLAMKRKKVTSSHLKGKRP